MPLTNMFLLIKYAFLNNMKTSKQAEYTLYD